MTHTNRTVLVTGASSGIGLAVTHQLLSQGFNVIGLGRSATALASNNAAYLGWDIDFTRPEDIVVQIKKLAKNNESTFSQLTSIICCAGQGRFGSLEEFSCRQIQDIININFTSHACLVRELLPTLKKQASQFDGGHIIFIGSEAALNGGRHGAIYSASKFALRGFSQALRQECSRDEISISIINPGMVRTPFFDQLRFRPGPEASHAILAEDVATAVSMVINMRNGTVIDEINLSPLQKVIQFDSGKSKQ